MEFLTNDKLTIVGAAGMIGSNMAQTALMMRLTPNICLYEKAGFPAMKFSSIGEQMASLAASLRPCSFTLEKARLLYLNTPDTIQVEGRPARRLGVPIEKVFTTLRKLKQEQERIFEP